MNKIFFPLCVALVMPVAPPAVAQMPATASNSARVRAIALTRQAEAAFYRRDFGATIAFCRRANRADPTYARAYTWLGAASEERRQPDLAREAYQRVLQLAPQSADAAHVRARLRVLGPAPLASIAPSPAISGRSLTVSLNGKTLPTRAVMGSSSRVLLPMRELFEALDAQVFFDAPTQIVAATRGPVSIELRPGDTSARVNGQSVTLDEPARLSGGTTLVPLRLVGEALGARVVYRTENNQVELTVAPLDPSARIPIAALPLPASTPKPAPSERRNSSSAAPALPPIAPAQAPVEPEVFVSPAPASRPVSPAPRPVEMAPDVTSPGVMNLPVAIPAQDLVVAGRLNPATRVRVGGATFDGAHLLSSDDPDVSFRLDAGQTFFEVRVALPDSSPGEWTEFLGWFDDNPNREAFPLMRVYRGKAPILLRVPLEGAKTLTLSPGFPGHPLALIAPRFSGLRGEKQLR